MWSAGAADDKERFLADLRALRDEAALEFDELAARAHYPSDVLKEAENGPSLPTLPILAAYVRACDADVPEWEERWRRLGVESRADPSLPVRPAGASPAAVAGARASVSVAPPDAYDPERIRAALRGSHGRSDGVAPGIVGQTTSWDTSAQPGTGTSWDAAAQPGTGTSWDAAAQPGTGTSWDAAAQPGTGTSWDGFQRETGPRWDGAAAGGTTDLSRTPTNGNHHPGQADDGSSDTAIMPVLDPARADTLRQDPFSADWLQDSDLTAQPEPEPGSPEPAETQASSAAADDWFTPQETTDPERTWSPAEGEPPADATDNWFTPRERGEGGPASPQPAERDVAPPQEYSGSAVAGVTGFWTPTTTASGPAEGLRPGPSPTQEHAIARASWPAAGESPASDKPGAADRTVPVLTPAAVPSRTIAGPAVPPGPVVPPSKSRSDRLYPVRLLVVIVVAALIGSILVLLLR
jgi:Helix-turn-helix domain